MKTTTNSSRICIAVLAFVALTCATSVDATPVTSDLVLWLDAQDVDGNNDGQSGGAVTNWVDKSGNGNDATNDVAVNQPTLVINGGPGGTTDAVNFDGDNWLDSLASINGDVSVIAVYNTDVGGLANDMLLSLDGTIDYYVESVQSSLTGGRIGVPGNAFLGRVQTSVVASTDYLLMWFAEWNTADGSELVIDGESKATADSSTAYSSVPTTITIVGNHPAHSIGFDGDLMELLIYDRALSDDEEIAVGHWLETKYGLTTAYPRPGTLVYGK